MGIKVCGIGVISAIGVNCKENLDSLRSQKCGIGSNTLFASTVSVPVGEVKKSNDELKALLNIPNSTTLSRTALLGAIAAREALLDANIDMGKRVGLISSTTVGGMDLSERFYQEFIIDADSGNLDEIRGHDCSVSTNFIAECCGIRGFRTTISTACSSAANAVILGARMLKNNMLDYVLVGGTDALCRFTLNGFNSLSILDSELCRPLDRDRKGLNLGEGAGFLVLARESDSEVKRYCTLAGYANANDAFHQTATSENGEGAFLAITKALDMSGLKREDIDYINLHGTGTENNDLSEIRAIKRVFANEIPPFSSTKGYTGHTLAAAGGLEAVYSVLSISEGIKYANLRFENEIEEGATPLIEADANSEVKSVISNSFGFGGNCSSLIFAK